MSKKKTTPKSEISAYFKKVVGWYLSGKMECTCPNHLLEKEYYELAETIAMHPMTKVINRDNKFYIVGMLDAFTQSHKYQKDAECTPTESVLWCVTERDYFLGTIEADDNGRRLPVMTDLSSITIDDYT